LFDFYSAVLFKLSGGQPQLSKGIHADFKFWNEAIKKLYFYSKTGFVISACLSHLIRYYPL